MRVTYSPENGDRQEWDFDPNRVRQADAELIEKRYGGRWAEFLLDVEGGGAKSRRVLLWHLMRRTHNTLRYEDVPDFYMGELEVDYTLSELGGIRERVLKMSIPEDEREQILTALDLGITDALAAGDESLGKAPSSNSGSATGSPSQKSPDSAPDSKRKS